MEVHPNAAVRSDCCILPDTYNGRRQHYCTYKFKIGLPRNGMFACLCCVGPKTGGYDL